MLVLRKFVAMLLLPLLAAAIVGFVLGTSVNETVLRANFLKAELTKVKAYEVLTHELQQQLTKSSGLPGRPAALSPQLSAIINSVVEPSWLQTEIERNLDALDGWLNRNQPLRLTLDLTSRRMALENALQKQLPDQVAATAANVLPNEIDLLDLNQSLAPFLEAINAPPLSGTDQIRTALESFKVGVEAFRRGLTISLVGIVIVGLLELMLMAPQRPRQIRWLSTMLWVSAVLLLAVGAIGVLGANALVVGQLALGGLQPATQAAIASLARNVLSTVSYPLLAVGVALLFGSLGVRLVAAFVRTPPSPPARH
ncbi:MAG: hypothetical protein HY567_00430 [Candidatus Kerfeldbacteria bacterium]|nr:hypothetical protein [Candidatus Kerfeldbacteria bacterium]